MRKILKEVIYFVGLNFGPMLKITWSYVVLLVCIDIPLEYFSEELGGITAYIVVHVLILFLIHPLYMGRLIKYMSAKANGEVPDTYISFAEWLNLLLVYLLSGLAVMLGFIALIIPGIYIGARYGFADFEAIIIKKRPFQSLKDSWGSTKNYVLLLVSGRVIIFGISLLFDLPLMLINDERVQVKMLAAIYSEIISLIYMIYISVFFFRIYLIANNQASHSRATPDGSAP